VLEAIKLGLWDFEPADINSDQFDRTDAMPGTEEKLEVLAARLQRGLPLWHPGDRDDLEDPPVHEAL
jgi:hypothetical protein